ATTGYACYFRSLGAAMGIAPERLRSLEPALAHIVGAQRGRLYYNLSHLHAVLRGAPLGEHLVSYFNLFVGAAERPDRPPGTEPRARRFGGVTAVAELVRIVARTTARLADLERGVSRFEARVDAYCRACDERLGGAPDAATLRELLGGFLEIRQHRWVEAAFADAASMIGYGVVRSLLAVQLADEDR